MKVSLSQDGSSSERASRSHEDLRIILRTTESESNGSSRFGSGSNVVISHVVVGPVESSALQHSGGFLLVNGIIVLGKRISRKTYGREHKSFKRIWDPHQQSQRIASSNKAHPHPCPFIVLPSPKIIIDRAPPRFPFLPKFTVIIIVRPPPFLLIGTGTGTGGRERSCSPKNIETFYQCV